MEEGREEVKEEEQEGIDVIENTSSENDSESEDESENESEDESKKEGIALVHFGNFKNYYKRRHDGLPAGEDRRLELMRKEWFECKDILDIGCNSGIFTINIAQTFSCRSVLGIDIDHDLIKKANSNLSKTAMLKPPADTPGESSKVKDKDHEEDSGNVAASSTSNEERNLLDIVSFKQEDFITSKLTQEELYDTILCLSVTQWIHLNCGDQGIITLFVKIWELLRPGGVLVLEPQGWSSYEKRHKLSIYTSVTYSNIEFFPEQFQEILLDKIGFRTVEYLNPSWRDCNFRFNRPVLVFKK